MCSQSPSCTHTRFYIPQGSTEIYATSFTTRPGHLQLSPAAIQIVKAFIPQQAAPHCPKILMHIFKSPLQWGSKTLLGKAHLQPPQALSQAGSSCPTYLVRKQPPGDPGHELMCRVSCILIKSNTSALRPC